RSVRVPVPRSTTAIPWPAAVRKNPYARSPAGETASTRNWVLGKEARAAPDQAAGGDVKHTASARAAGGRGAAAWAVAATSSAASDAAPRAMRRFFMPVLRAPGREKCHLGRLGRGTGSRGRRGGF